MLLASATANLWSGAAIALVAGSLAFIGQRSNERRRWLRDARLEAYVAMAKAAQEFTNVAADVESKDSTLVGDLHSSAGQIAQARTMIESARPAKLACTVWRVTGDASSYGS